ncbi:MAG TPA: hypothetical protein PLJ23_01925 [Gemmatimonadales bacterium]|nr:hypothetical protein [Gemmatimonadales bacterium]
MTTSVEWVRVTAPRWNRSDRIRGSKVGMEPGAHHPASALLVVAG